MTDLFLFNGNIVVVVILRFSFGLFMFANPLVNTVCKVQRDSQFCFFHPFWRFVHLKFHCVGANFLGAKSNFIAKT